MLDGEVQVDESYLGGMRKGKRARGAAGKTPAFGQLKRNGRVYTYSHYSQSSKHYINANYLKKVKPDSIVYTDTFKSYHALDVSEFKHFRINYSEIFAKGYNHINAIENFCNQAKRHLRKLNGIPKEHFYLYLKECEWRFNHSDSKEQLCI